MPAKASQRRGHPTEREKLIRRPRQETAGRIGGMNPVHFGCTIMCVHTRAHVCAHLHMFVSAHLNVGVGENRGVSLERWPWIGSCKAGGPKRTLVLCRE